MPRGDVRLETQLELREPTAAPPVAEKRGKEPTFGHACQTTPTATFGDYLTRSLLAPVPPAIVRTMQRKTFLGVVGTIGLLIGLVALTQPAVILAGKGVTPIAAASVWMREVGVLIVALSVIALLVRRDPDSSSMRALLWGNALVHVGLFPIEIFAWHSGIVTRLDGIVPNSLFHVLVAAGFVFYARRVRGDAVTRSR